MLKAWFGVVTYFVFPCVAVSRCKLRGMENPAPNKAGQKTEGAPDISSLVGIVA